MSYGDWEPNTPPTLGSWYTAKQAAEILKITVDTVYQWARTGPLNARRRGNRIYFAQDEIRRIAAGRYQRWLREKHKAELTGREPKNPINPPSVRHMGAFADSDWTDPDGHSASSSKRPLTPKWISPKAAAAILEITPGAVHNIARKNMLTRRRTEPGESVTRHPSSVKPQRPWWLYDKHEIECLAAKRNDRKERRGDPRNSLKHWGDRRRIPEWLPVDEFISTREAAFILQCTPDNVCHLVRTGVLPGFQKRPGKQGSPLMLVNMHVTNLAARQTYREKRARWKKGRERGDSDYCPRSCPGPHVCSAPGETPPCNPRYTTGWEERDLEPINPRRHTKFTERDYGEFYSTRQAALHLGVSRTRILALRRTGALKGYQRPQRTQKITMYHREPKGYGNRWWFFKKDDVWDLKNDRDYEKRRRAWERSNTPEARAERESKQLHEQLMALERAKAAFEKEHGKSPLRDSDYWKLHLI